MKTSFIIIQNETFEGRFQREDLSANISVYKIKNPAQFKTNGLIQKISKSCDLLCITNQHVPNYRQINHHLISSHKNEPKSLICLSHPENKVVLSDPGFFISFHAKAWDEIGGFSPYLKSWCNRYSEWKERALHKGMNLVPFKMKLTVQNKKNSKPRFIYDALANDETYLNQQCLTQNYLKLKKPDFLILGTQKSSTTSLVTCLSNHPDVHIPAIRSSHKDSYEFHYYNQRHKDFSDEWYESYFYHPSKKISGEKSPSYLSVLGCHQRIQKHCPHAKLIVSLRKPADRTWSAINHYISKSNTAWLNKNNFSGLKASEIYDKLILNFEKDEIKNDVIKNSIYVEQLKNLMQYFPKEQIMVFIHERMHKDAAALQKQLCKFLNIKEQISTQIPFVNKGSYQSQRSETSTKKYTELFKPYNEQLFELLGYDIPEWET